MALRTRFSDAFGLDHPLLSAPMAMHSGGRLAGAVSAAGALGSFGGMHTAREPTWVTEQVELIRESTDRPFAVGFITPFLAIAEPFLAAAIEAQPDAVVLSFADPGPWMPRLRDAGIAVICQVQDPDGASQAVDAGADVLVVQGTAAGGHTGTIELLPLLTRTVERFPDVPVLAAGGIADGRTLAAALLAGADGAVVGTALLATSEAVEVDDRYKQLIVSSNGDDTVLTQTFDIISGLPWPETIRDRVRRNRTTDEWAGREAELRARRGEVAGAYAPGGGLDPERDAVRYGQSAGAVDAIRPAGDVVRAISETAEAILRDRPDTLLA